MRITFVGCGDAFASGGRFNTCFHVATDPRIFLIDCGASSLVALRRAGIDRLAIDTVHVTHFHADHFGGIPFLVLDAQFAGRTAPLTIVGPRGLAAQYERAMETAFAGSASARRKFEVRLVEIEPGERRESDGLRVTATAVRHSKALPVCLGYRFETGDRTLAYTGDTEWDEALIPLGCDADLLIAEANFDGRDVPGHMNLATLRRNLPRIGARRVILTHMGEEVLARRESLGIEAAEDGLVVSL